MRLGTVHVPALSHKRTLPVFFAMFLYFLAGLVPPAHEHRAIYVP